MNSNNLSKINPSKVALLQFQFRAMRRFARGNFRALIFKEKTRNKIQKEFLEIRNKIEENNSREQLKNFLLKRQNFVNNSYMKALHSKKQHGRRNKMDDEIIHE
jgi:hypothetical protein